MSDEVTTVTPRRPCPTCSFCLDRATAAFDEDAVPEAGDITLCIQCGETLVFNPDLSIRRPTAEEIAEWTPETRKQIHLAASAIQHVQRIRATR